MNVIIVGLGRIGTAILEKLVAEKHDVLIIDENPQVIKQLSNHFDVMAICDKGISHKTLLEAGVDKCDVFIATTNSDAINMITCFIAKDLGAKYTVARIRNEEYNDENLEYLQNKLNISLAINPERLTANAIYNLLRLPSATNVETFKERAFEMLEVIIQENSVIANKTLKDLRKEFPQKFLVTGVLRKDGCFIPNGDTVLLAGDKISLIVSKGETQKLLKSFKFIHTEAKKVMIIGAGKTAYYLSEILAKNKYQVKIIEKDFARSVEASNTFPPLSVIINGDGMSHELLQEEALSSYDAVVSLTGKDEENVMIAVYALAKGVKKVIPKVKRSEVHVIADGLNLDTILSPQQEVADVIIKHVRSIESESVSQMERYFSILDGKAESMEFKVLENFAHVNVPLKDLNLKSHVLIVGIVRKGVSIIPGGNDTIEVGDSIIVVTDKDKLYDLNDVFSR